MADTTAQEAGERNGLHDREDEHDGDSYQVYPREHLNPCNARSLRRDNDGGVVLLDVVLHDVHLFVQGRGMRRGEVEHRHDERHEHDAHQHAAVEPVECFFAQEDEETAI